MKFNFIECVRSISIQDQDRTVWAHRLLDAFAPLNRGLGVAVLERGPRSKGGNQLELIAETGSVPCGWFTPFKTWYSQAPKELLCPMLNTSFAGLSKTERFNSKSYGQVYKEARVYNTFTFAVPDGEVDFQLHIGIPNARSSIPPALRKKLSQLLYFLESTINLRRLLNGKPLTLENADAVYAYSGKIEHIAPEIYQQTNQGRTLADVARKIMYARNLGWTSQEEALSLLRQCFDSGSFMDYTDTDGRRYILVKLPPNGNSKDDPLALSLLERETIKLAVEGKSNKVIGEMLRCHLQKTTKKLSSSSVAGYMKSSQKKLGLKSRSELIALASLIYKKGS